MDATLTSPRTGARLHRFANPGRFLRIASAVQPWLSALAVLVTGAGLVWALFVAPADWQQGDAVRIMYVHVPAAWLASMGYFALAACSAASIIWRHPLADLAAVEIGPVGAAFTALCLVTGSLWGKPMWGAWWVWDARLTSVLVLFFIYLGHIALVRAFDDPQRGYRAGAILALVGVVNLPIIKFSVDWWNTLHQPATITLTGAPTMALTMLWPLLVCAIGYTLVFAALVVARTRAAVMERRIRGLLHGPQRGGGMTHLGFIVASYGAGGRHPGRVRGVGHAAAGRGPPAPGRHRPAQRAATRVMTRKSRRMAILLACGLGLGSATALVAAGFQQRHRVLRRSLRHRGEGRCPADRCGWAAWWSRARCSAWRRPGSRWRISA